MGSRFDGQVFTFSQPDGTPIQVRGWADQYYAVFETLDGYTVAKNPAAGYWEVARRDYRVGDAGLSVFRNGAVRCQRSPTP